MVYRATQRTVARQVHTRELLLDAATRVMTRGGGFGATSIAAPSGDHLLTITGRARPLRAPRRFATLAPGIATPSTLERHTPQRTEGAARTPTPHLEEV